MGNKISFHFGDLKVEAELNDSRTSDAILHALPMESVVNLWGSEIYFETPVVSDLENDVVTEILPGDIGYWPVGRALCIFFGPTPLSQGQEIVPAGPVNIIGRINGDIGLLKKVEEREIVKVIKIMNKEVSI